MQQNINTENVLRQLANTPERMTSVCQGVNIIRLNTKPDKESWSANDILAHLRACADVWGGSIKRMIGEDHPTIYYISPRTWMKKTNYFKLDYHSSFNAFVKQRIELLGILEVLSPEDWARGAMVYTAKIGREWTVLGYAQRMANHEGDHTEQLEAMFENNRR